MKQKIKRLFQHMMNWRGMYVIADPRDSSITLSPSLYKHMRDYHMADGTEVFVFALDGEVINRQGKVYAFTNQVKEIHQETQTSMLQENTKHNTVGFCSLNPTVAKIFYDYDIRPHDKPRKLSVRPMSMWLDFYIIDRK